MTGKAQMVADNETDKNERTSSVAAHQVVHDADVKLI